MSEAHETLDELARYRGRNRLLLIFAPAPDTQECRQQEQALASESAGLAERDLLIGRLYEGTESRIGDDPLDPHDEQAIRDALRIGARQFVVALVGKDGGVKRRSSHPLPAQDLFATIDAMPMRRDEMRQRGEGGDTSI